MAMKIKGLTGYVSQVANLVKKTNVYAAALGVLAKVGGVYVAQTASDIFMLASNRFEVGQDTGVGDSNLGGRMTGTISGTTLTFTGFTGHMIAGMNLSGSGVTSNTTIISIESNSAGVGSATVDKSQTVGPVTMNTSGADWLGGNGIELIGRSLTRSMVFDTTWAPLDGIFHWWNKMLLPGGLIDCQALHTYKKCEIWEITARDPVTDLPTAWTFVQAVTWNGGSPTLDMTPGLSIGNDPIPLLKANTSYQLDMWVSVPLGGGWPSTASNFLPGDRSGSSTSVDLSLTPMPRTSGKSSAIGGAGFGPVAFYAKGWDGSPCGLVIGDSTTDKTNTIGPLRRRDLDHAQSILGSATGGRMNHASMVRYSGAFAMITNPQPIIGTTSVGMFDGLRAVLPALLGGQTRAPFQFIYSSLLKNNWNIGTAAGVMAALTACINNARTAWPGIPWFQETATPGLTTATNNSAQTNDTDVTPSANMALGTSVNASIMAAAGGVTLGVDVAVVLRSANNANWKTDGFVADLITGFTANSTSTVTLSVAPEVGTGLAFDAGTGTADPAGGATGATGYQVYSVTPNGPNFDVVLYSLGRSPILKNVTLAHAAGTGNVKGATAPDGNHAAHKGTLQMITQGVTYKPAMAAAANAYTGA